MIVEELIEILEKMPQKSNVRIQEGEKLKEVNYWVRWVESHDKGTSGYEKYGEVVIIGDE